MQNHDDLQVENKPECKNYKVLDDPKRRIHQVDVNQHYTRVIRIVILFCVYYIDNIHKIILQFYFSLQKINNIALNS